MSPSHVEVDKPNHSRQPPKQPSSHPTTQLTIQPPTQPSVMCRGHAAFPAWVTSSTWRVSLSTPVFNSKSRHSTSTPAPYFFSQFYNFTRSLTLRQVTQMRQIVRYKRHAHKFHIACLIPSRSRASLSFYFGHVPRGRGTVCIPKL